MCPANPWMKLPKPGELGSTLPTPQHRFERLPSGDLEASLHGTQSTCQETSNANEAGFHTEHGGRIVPEMMPRVKVPGSWEERQQRARRNLGQMTFLVLVLLVVLRSTHNGACGYPSAAARMAVEADIGVVAADEGRCSTLGIKVLKAGGNAVDAAVTVALCLGVLNPMASGIGGGNFMLVRMANGTAELIDSRETAPAAASQDMFSNNSVSSVKGGQSIGVPGELAGLHLAWQRFGRLPWSALVKPAAELAVDGFEVSRYLAAAINASAADILADPDLGAIFAPGGKPLQAGDTCHWRKLGETLFQVAEHGPSLLYGGPLGEKLAADIQAAGGIVTADDLANFRAEIREPLIGQQAGLTVIGAPPPSSGGPTVIQILKILAGYPLSLAAAGALGLHRSVEAMKHAFALRMALGDPAFVDDTAVLADMLSDDFASLLRANISDSKTFNATYYGGKWNQLNDHGTTHFSIVDGDRNAVSLTSTVNLGFGSRVLSPSTGIILNDEMDDFSIPGEPNVFGLPPSEANFIRPGKRPLSSMAPLIVLQDGQLRAVVGGSGGPFIISATAQVLLNYFERGLSPLEAVLAPRVHHQLLPNYLFVESTHTLLNGVTVSMDPALISAMERRGHEVLPIAYGGVVQLIVHDLEVPAANRTGFQASPNSPPGVVYGRLTAVSDPRKDGHPAGW